VGDEAFCADAPARRGEPTSEAAAYCEKVLAIETAPDPDIDFETATPDQLQAAAKGYATQLLPRAEQAAAAAPAEINPDVDRLVGATGMVSQTGDFSMFESDQAVLAAEDRAHAFELDNCGCGKAAVTAKEYSFEGLPKQSEEGPVSLDLKNEGKEPHELILLRINDGVEETFDELLDLPEEESSSKSEFFAIVEPVDAGDNDHTIVNLTPGRYGVICTIPVVGGKEGAPHFTEGMKGEFEVG